MFGGIRTSGSPAHHAYSKTVIGSANEISVSYRDVIIINKLMRLVLLIGTNESSSVQFVLCPFICLKYLFFLRPVNAE